MIALLLFLAGCPAPSDTDDTSAPFVDPLDPDDVHILVTSLPAWNEAPDVVELAADLTDRWSWSVDDGGALGAVRLDDGSTVFGHSALPPVLDSSVDKVDADGNLLWSYSNLFLAGMGFCHGVVRTPEGDYIALDSSGSRLVAFDEAGTQLWEYYLYNLPSFGSPNGVALSVQDGATWLAVTQLMRGDGGGSDMVTLFTLGERTAEPTPVLSVDLLSEGGDLSWPHGPRFATDGTLVLCLAALGQVIGMDLQGNELWRIPEGDKLGTLAFPREADFLPDGSLVVSDAGIEILRVADPMGAFDVVAARLTPGTFTVDPVVCGEGGGLPCLGHAGR